MTGKESLTATTVARVAAARQRSPARYDGIFDQIEALTQAGAVAAREGEFGNSAN